MKTHLRRLGNSKGVLLPAAALAASGIGDEIELTVSAGRIVITPAVPDRQGWFDGYQAEEDTDAWGRLVATDADSGEWEW
ncbi:MAG: AbrB/MazE/SpoVT family DNA-binding domain-containing protein [Methylococcaceae bacterium]|nr:MAG: AbrB/MazE/SpoVT family DNA-binding domain-containing protein [Methylococcaceae bacterium]